jgi:hypothetical protein
MKKQSLSKFEHYLLSSTLNGLEPLNVLYTDIMNRFPGATLDMIIVALVKLTKMGLVDCYYYTGKKSSAKQHCKALTEEQLRKHCSGRSEEDLRNFPDKTGDYEFQATQKGREEEAKDIYNAYYHFSESDERWHVVGGNYEKI